MPTRIRKDDGTYIDADDIGTQGDAVTALTDSTGGTANATLTAVGGLTTLTDSTGYSGTHDDTLAATTIPTITATNPAAPTAYSAHTAGATPVTSNAATDLDTTAAAVATLRSEVATYETAISALVVDVAAILAVITVMTQNASDTAQKVIEIVTDLEDVKNNFADLNGQINTVITSLEGGGSLTAN